MPAYADLAVADIYKGISDIQEGTSKSKKPFKQNTISDYMSILKQFLLWMIENGYSTLSEKKIRGIKS
ncbi:MAG: integrase, partial [Methanomicrobiales archaeon]|nr:integrase [Methanomicrobiales archaeon]